MQQPAPRSRTVFRACVVNAVREGEALITELIKVTRGALKGKEAEMRDIARRNLLSDALQLLDQHEAAMVKAYPMALLEIFADGPGAAKAGQSASSPLDFGELSLVDDDEVQAQVELSRAHQQALHATDAVLAELNGLVSAAQGLYRVQPERNPLRPENYIRALQQVVAETGVAAPIRELWMQHMRDLLGTQLVDVYKRASQSLRDHGVLPVGYGVASGPGMTGMGGLGRVGGASAHGGGYGPSAWAGAAPTGYGGMGGPTGYGNPSMYGRGGMASGWSDPGAGAMAPDAEEALLTVGILRQMLAGGGDPFDASRGLPVAPSMRGGWVDPAGGTSTHGAPISGHYPSAAVSEAMEDIAQLERLVGRLAHSQPGYAPSGQGSTHSLYGVAYGSAAESPAMAAEVVARMVENISQDSRLLPPVQRAVQNLEPAIRKLVRHDPRFFSDGNHPARRLLNSMAQAGVLYGGEGDERGLLAKMQWVVERVIHGFAGDLQLFESLLDEFNEYAATLQHKVELRERRAVEAAKGRDKLLGARQLAIDVVATALNERTPPAIIRNFLELTWADVLVFVLLRHGERSEEWQRASEVAEQLAWSGTPLDASGRERLSGLRIALLEDLRKGLELLGGYHEDGIRRLLQDIVACQHAVQAKQPLIAAKLNPTLPTSQLGAMLGEDAELATSAPRASGLSPRAQQLVKELESIEFGTWFEFVINGQPRELKLSWFSPTTRNYMFVDHSGQRVAIKPLTLLASEMEQGLARIITPERAGPLVDRALNAIYRVLQRFTGRTAEAT